MKEIATVEPLPAAESKVLRVVELSPRHVDRPGPAAFGLVA
jgi:hypothetical protein